MAKSKLQSLYDTYQGRRLQDDGAYVSKEFNNFQNAFFRAMKELADEIGATIAAKSKGHYDMSVFFERNGKYVYLSYGRLDRTKVDLTSHGIGFYARTAAHVKDYRGGANNWTGIDTLKRDIDRLLNTEHHQI